MPVEYLNVNSFIIQRIAGPELRLDLVESKLFVLANLNNTIQILVIISLREYSRSTLRFSV